jgi:hypothetical protein
VYSIGAVLDGIPILEPSLEVLPVQEGFLRGLAEVPVVVLVCILDRASLGWMLSETAEALAFALVRAGGTGPAQAEDALGSDCVRK